MITRKCQGIHQVQPRVGIPLVSLRDLFPQSSLHTTPVIRPLPLFRTQWKNAHYQLSTQHHSHTTLPSAARCFHKPHSSISPAIQVRPHSIPEIEIVTFFPAYACAAVTHKNNQARSYNDSVASQPNPYSRKLPYTPVPRQALHAPRNSCPACGRFKDQS